MTDAQPDMMLEDMLRSDRMTSVRNLEQHPEVLYLPMLSNKYIEAFMLDYSRTATHTHKVQKGLFTVDYCRNKLNAPIILFGNFGKELRHDSEGSGMDAMELASYYYPDTQVVGFVDSRQPKVMIEPVHPDFPNGRKRIRLGVDTSDYLGPSELEEAFRWYLSNFADVSEFLLDNGIDPKARSVAATNIAEFAGDENPYVLNRGAMEDMQHMDVVVSTAGSGERLLGQIMSLDNYGIGRYKGMHEPPIHLTMVTANNPLNPYASEGESLRNRLDTAYANPSHHKILDHSRNNPLMLFKLAKAGKKNSSSTENDIRDGSGIATMLRDNGYPHLRVGSTGALGLSILTERNYIIDPEPEQLSEENRPYASQGGILFPGLYRYKGTDGEEPVAAELFLPSPVSRDKYNVCVVYTGCSDNELLKRLVAQQEMR